MLGSCTFIPYLETFPPSTGGGGGAVTSVFGRTGAVVAMSGDYSAFYLPLTLNDTQILVGNGSNVATAVTMSGDATLSNTGALTISNNAITTAKILNSNVTYGKIQNVAATSLVGNSTGGAGVMQDITLGTNLSFTGTTLNAAGGGYVYSAITLSGPTTLNKSDLAGANYLFLSTNDTTIRTLTIGTGFIANDYLVLSFNANSPGLITLIIGTTPRTIATNRSNIIEAVYNGTEWVLGAIANSYITSIEDNTSTVIGFGARIPQATTLASPWRNVVIGTNASSTDSSTTVIGYNSSATNTNAIVVGTQSSSTSSAIIIGNFITNAGPASVSIGASSVSGTGANCVRIGNGVTTSINTGVVAIGQGITSTNTDAVVIGRSAGGGGIRNITIGANSTGTGAETIRIGRSITTVAAADCIVMGRQSTIASSIDYIVILGGFSTTLKARTFNKGFAAYSRHYGAESRRIDTEVSLDDSINPSRHNENTAWIGTTLDATPKILTLFDVFNERLTLEDNEALHFDIMITAKQNGSTNTLVRRIAGGAVRGSGVGTTTIVGQTTLYTHGTALTTTVSADTTNGAVVISVTGNANTWQWTALVNYQRTRTA